MRKILYLLLTGIIISSNLQSKNISDFFVDMPSVLIPTLGSSFRVELVESYHKTGKDSIQNAFGTNVKLLSIDTISQNISLKTTSNSRFEMQMIKQGNDTIIGIINTVCAPICSSYTHFYDTEWKEVKSNLPKYTYKDWLKTDNSAEDNKTVSNLVKVSFIELKFSAENEVIIVKNNSLEYLSGDDQKEILPFVENKNLTLKFSELGLK